MGQRWVDTDSFGEIKYHNYSSNFQFNVYMKNKYSDYRNLARSMNNRARRIFNSTQLNKHIPNPRQLWKCFYKIIHNKSNTLNQINSIATADGKLTNDPVNISNTINEYFCNIGRELLLKIPRTEPTNHSKSDSIQFANNGSFPDHTWWNPEHNSKEKAKLQS